MVGKQSSHLIFGIREYNVRTIRDTLAAAEELKVDFVVTPLFHPRLRRDLKGVSGSRTGKSTYPMSTLSYNMYDSVSYHAMILPYRFYGLSILESMVSRSLLCELRPDDIAVHSADVMLCLSW